MKIKIYQINAERDKNRVIFCGSRLQMKYMKRDKFIVDRNIYNMVYECKVDCKYLDDVWTKFNTDLPEDYRARSLSVSDVIEVIESEDIVPGFYFCDSFGFKKIDF